MVDDEAAGRLVGAGRSAGALIAGGVACIAFAFVLALRTPMPSDTAWLLWVAHRSLQGAVVYRDIVQVNPPLSHWLHLPPVMLSELTGWPVKPIFVAMVLVSSTACVALAAVIWRSWEDPPTPAVGVGVAAGVVAVALAGPFFGQREQFILAAAVPWLALLAVRQGGFEVPLLPALLAGAVLAFGIALKPFYIGWWAGSAALWRWGPREQGRPLRPFWRWPEFWVVPALGILYLVLVQQTAYPAFLRGWSDLYWRYFHRSWWFVMAGNPFALLPLGGLLLTIRAAWRSALGAVLWVGTASAWVGAVGQGKAFPYHYWPAVALAVLLLTHAGRATRRALVMPVAASWLAYLAFMLVDGGSAHWRNADALGRAAGSGSVLTLSSTADDAWLLTSERGRPWLSPQYDLWWLAVSGGAERVRGVPDWAARDSVLRASLLPAKEPDVLLLSVSGVDISSYLARSAEWRRLLSAYRPGEVVAGYRVWRRKGAV